MPIRRFSVLVTLVPALVLPGLSACGGGSQTPAVQQTDLVGVLETRPSLTRFTEALRRTGVFGLLQSDGDYTIFAPMDRAVDGAVLDDATVRHHILPTRVTFSDMAGDSASYETLNGDEIEIDVTDRIAIGDGLMVESDIQATNGVIHVIDTVLEPSADAAGDEEPNGDLSARQTSTTQ